MFTKPPGAMLAFAGLAARTTVAVAAPTGDLSPPPATAALAGAARCKLDAVVTLGLGRTTPVIAMRGVGGLAVWRRDDHTVAYGALASNGTLRGTPSTTVTPDDRKPARVYAVNAGYVVVLSRWDVGGHDARWWVQLVGLDGHPRGALLDLGVADMVLDDGRVLGGERIAWNVAPAAIAPAAARSLPAHAQVLTIAADGTLTTQSTTGRFETSSLAPVPPIAAAVVADLEPIPAHNGTSIEPMARPYLARTAAGQAVGEHTELVVDGNYLGAYGFHYATDLAWTGTHYLYPVVETVRDVYVAQLLPIDCRP